MTENDSRTAPGADGAPGPRTRAASEVPAQPEPGREPRRSSPRASVARRRRGKRIIAVVAASAVLCAAGGGAAIALSQGSGASFRTASAELAPVEQTLALSGTVASASRADAAFQVGGTVSSVGVAVGDTVTAGQQLATLDTTDLTDAVESAEAAVTNAENQLTTDLETQASGGTSSSSGSSDSAAGGAGGTAAGAGTGGTATGGASGSDGAPTGGGTGSGGTGSGDTGSGDTGSGGTGTGGTDTGSGGTDTGSGGDTGSGDGSGDGVDTDAVQAAIARVTAAQQSLLTHYEATAAATAATQETIAASDASCRPFLEATVDGLITAADSAAVPAADSAVADPTAADSAADDSTASDQNQATLDAIKADLAACQSAITEVQTEQSSAAAAQTALLDLMSQLDTAVAALQSALTSAISDVDAYSTSSATSPAASAYDITVILTAAPGVTDTGATSATITAETIVADQAAIDLAQAELAIARQQLSSATLTSPLAGTVAAVTLATGDTVSARSDSALVTVIGDDGYVVTSTVTLANVGDLAAGQTAEVTLPSSDVDALTGTVGSIGVLNVSTDSSTPSYDVTIAIDPTDAALLNGASAQAIVSVAAEDDVLTVPTSAIHRDGGTYTVDVLDAGTAAPITVEVGSMGAERTEIVSGLVEGDTVVLADLDAAVPGTDADESDAGSSGLTGLGGTSGTGTATFPGGATFQGGPAGVQVGPPSP